MVVAGGLALRKKMRLRRMGSAQLWMRMHIWLSLVAIPLIWFHSGFALGGPLTTVLMVLFYVVVLSGAIGLLLQQILPRVMTERVPLETVRVQIDHVVAGLAASAYEVVAAVTGPIEEADRERARIDEELAVEKVRLAYWKKADREPVAEEVDPRSAPLRKVYLEEIRPYLWRATGDTRSSVPDVRRRLSELPTSGRGGSIAWWPSSRSRASSRCRCACIAGCTTGSFSTHRSPTPCSSWRSSTSSSP